MEILSPATLHLSPPAVQRPAYDPATVTPGILHLGAGAFHRAHQAVYTDECLGHGDTSWGIIAANLHSTALREALGHQGGLYALEHSSAAGRRLRIIAAIRACLVGRDDPAALVAAMARPEIRILSLTITEKGYCLDPASGDLAASHADIVHDLAHRDQPRSAPGFICAALRQRMAARIAPFTLLSCDNLARNGRVLKRVLMQFAELRDPALARFIGNHVASPATMVDRIVPATTPGDRERIAAGLGLYDTAPVVGEAFAQWIIEDNFPAGRPDWAAGGATFVHDAGPWETMKLRLLNGAHSTLAWLGLLAGKQTVADAMADPAIASFVARLMREEIAPVLHAPPGADLVAYIAVLLARFGNPFLQHRTAQIAGDSSQKLPQRLLPTIRARLAANLPFPLLALAVAAWIRCTSGLDDAGGAIEFQDPLAAELRRRALAAGGSPAALVASLTGIEAIFGHDLPHDLPRDPRFRHAVTQALEALAAHGVRPAMARAMAANTA